MYTIIAHIEYPKRANCDKYEVRLKSMLKNAGASSAHISRRDLRTAMGAKMYVKAPSYQGVRKVVSYLKKLKYETIYSANKKTNEIYELWVESDK